MVKNSVSGKTSTEKNAKATRKPIYDPKVLACAASSGVLEGALVQPLELLKTRFQINTGPRLRMIPTIREIIAEGGFFQLYRGGLPEIAGLIPRSTAQLTSLEFFREFCRSRNGGKLRGIDAYASGVFAGIFEALSFTPFQVVKVRLMAKEHLGKYKNSFDCTAKIVRSEGIQALTIGLFPTVWRNCIWNGIYYGSFYQFQQWNKKAKLGLFAESVTGFCIGVGATCLNAPFDVVKSRFQSQMGENRRYKFTLPSLWMIYKEEGLANVYRGLTPKALRLGFGGTVGLQLFEYFLTFVKDNDDD